MPRTESGFNGEYRFLSNFFPSMVEFEGLSYITVEHAYQAAKTLDQDIRKAIAAAPDAATAKRMGRTVVLREDWDDVKLPIMKRLLQKKFYDPILRSRLINTINIELVEVNYWHDNYWGHCTCMRCERFSEEVGNHLGKLLMEVREEIIRSNAPVS